MKYLNSKGYSEDLYNFLVRVYENDPYDNDGDIGTTTLSKPIQAVALERANKENLSRDVEDGLASLIGTGIHSVLERGAKEGDIIEKRFYEVVDGIKLSGKIDRWSDGVLYDYKCTKTFSAMKEVSPDWISQGNVNRWLMHKNGVEVKKLVNYLFLKDRADWVKRKDYPVTDVVEVELPIWALSETEFYIKGKIAAFKKALKMTADELADTFPCSNADRWFNEKSQQFIRCERFCVARPFCKQIERHG